ncbi:GNAT family N-acetyltransferase [Streptomyces sp. NPDC060031]|uniref:GNAT family N-acetyltransferase n=1 Tax=Streptomyces sp. NPDC060031 TaxID=3347043 RepID=UPI00368F2896
MDVEVRAPRGGDVEVLAELRAEVMRGDLERLGRYDERRVRQRLLDSFSAEHSSVLVARGQVVGCFTVRPDGDGLLLEHFIVAAEHQGRGIGSRVLRGVLERADAQGVDVRLNVLRGPSPSPAWSAATSGCGSPSSRPASTGPSSIRSCG